MPRTPIAVLFCALLCAPARAQQPAPDADLKSDLKALSASHDALKAGRYRQEDHAAVSRVLEALPKKAKTFGGEAALLKVQKDLQAAAAVEKVFWDSLSPDQKEARVGIPAETRDPLAAKIKKASEAVSSLLTAETAPGRAPAPRGSQEEAQERAETERISRTVQNIAARTSTEDSARRTFENSGGRGSVSAPRPAASRSRVRPSQPAPPKGFIPPAVPPLAPKAPVAESPAAAGFAAPALRGAESLTRITGPPMAARAPNICAESVKDHSMLSGLCGGADPGSWTAAGVNALAGLFDAFKEQFGTVMGIVSNLVFMLLGLLLSALSGFGLILKVITSLLSFGLLGWMAYSLIKDVAEAIREFQGSAAGTAERLAAWRKLGKIVGNVMIIGLMIFAGYKIGKTKPGQAMFKSMNDGLANKLTSFGMKDIGAAMDKTLPAPIKGFLTRFFPPAAPEAGPAKAAPPEPGAPAARAKATTPKMAENQARIDRALRDQFEVRGEEFGKGPKGPSEFVGKLQKAEALPPNPPANAAQEVRLRAETARKDAVARMAKDFLGLEERPRVTAPKTDPTSGAQVYILENADGSRVGVLKVFVDNGKGPLTIMNELGAGREFGAQNVKLSKPVEALGASRLGDSGELALFMKAAPGKDYYARFAELGKLPEGSASRKAALAGVEADVEIAAKALAERHSAGARGKMTLQAKQKSVSGALANLQEMRSKMPEPLFEAMKARLKALGDGFLKEDIPGSITHGDAHPGNLFIDKGRITLIDMETAMEAVGPRGEGINSPLADAGRFVESLRLNSKPKALGLTGAELNAIENRFLEAYAREMKIDPAAFKAHLDYYRARLQVTALKYAKDGAGFGKLLEQVKADPGLNPQSVVLPRSVGAAAKIEFRSRIKDSSFAIRQAENLGEQAQRDVNALLDQFSQGNANPGIGTRALGDGFYELRGRNGGRVIVKQTGAGAFDIVGKFQGHVRGDAANSAVIQRLTSDYGSR